MAVTTLSRPCWSFTCGHEATEAERPHAIVPQWLPTHEGSCTDRPYQLGSPCVVVTCDGCNTVFDGRCASHDGWHFPTVAHALAALADSSWFRDTDGRWHLPGVPRDRRLCPARGLKGHPEMTMLFRKTLRFGPLWLNFSKTGMSWSIHIGPWSWNSRTRAQRVDLPGPFSWRGRRSDRRTSGKEVA